MQIQPCPWWWNCNSRSQGVLPLCRISLLLVYTTTICFDWLSFLNLPLRIQSLKSECVEVAWLLTLMINIPLFRRRDHSLIRYWIMNCGQGHACLKRSSLLSAHLAFCANSFSFWFLFLKLASDHLSHCFLP